MIAVVDGLGTTLVIRTPDPPRRHMEETSGGNFDICPASAQDADVIGTLAARLLSELYPDFGDVYQPEKLIAVTRKLLERSASVFGFLARDRTGETVGVLMLNQCEAIYAFGCFGEISELYVDPRHRSSGLGAALLQTAVVFARARKWSMLEVGAPDVPRWQKTVDFYARNGFVPVGPRLYLPLTQPSEATAS